MKLLRSICFPVICVLFASGLVITEGKRCEKKGGGKKECVLKRARREKGGKESAPHWRRGPPKDGQIIVREGTDITLSCSVKGSPKPHMKWELNHRPLNGKSSPKYRQRKNRLTVRDVKIQDTASYTCVAENKLGKLSFTYFIKVLENMPMDEIEVVDRPENQTAHVGDTVIFMCRSHDWPKPLVHWTRTTNSRKLMEVIATSDNSVSNNTDVLVLHNVTKDDSGVYTCYIATKKVSKQLSATLTVIEEGESLPFEPPCSLHVRRHILVDHSVGCRTAEPVEMHYCMGSCGRSYYIPKMIPTDANRFASHQVTHLNRTCKCCVGVVDSLRIVELECSLGKKKRGFYTLLSDCRCSDCSAQEPMMQLTGEEDTKISKSKKKRGKFKG